MNIIICSSVPFFLGVLFSVLLMGLFLKFRDCGEKRWVFCVSSNILRKKVCGLVLLSMCYHSNELEKKHCAKGLSLQNDFMLSDWLLCGYILRPYFLHNFFNIFLFNSINYYKLPFLILTIILSYNVALGNL